MARKTTATTTGAAAATKLAVAAAAVGTQAKAQASDLGDRIAPVVGDARDRIAPVVGDARDRIVPVVGDAVDRLTPVVEDARDRLAPVVDDARERLVDLSGTVATRIDDLTSGVSDRLVDLTGTVATRIDEALPDRVTPAVVTARVPRTTKDHPSRPRQAAFVLGLGAAAAFIANRLTGQGSRPVWRSAAEPSGPVGTPAGEGTGLTTTTTAASAGGVAGETVPVTPSVDVAGGTPEEVAADATDTPHAVTTPDQPAQKVILD